MGKVLPVLLALSAMVALTIAVTAAPDQLKSIEATLNTLVQSASQINQKLSQQESALNGQKNSLVSMSKSVQSHDTLIHTLQTEMRTISAKGRDHDKLLLKHQHNLTNFNHQVAGYEVKVSHDDALIKNLSRDSFASTNDLNAIQTSINTQDAKLNQHESEIKDHDQEAIQLADELRKEDAKTTGLKTGIHQMTSVVSNFTVDLEAKEYTMMTIGQQMMHQQTFVEERIRTEGMSGIKSLRHIREGTRTYYADHYIGGSALSAHDHADYDRTIGLGEFVAVMNGVDFRTRHNDYKFRMPAHTKNFNEIEDVPFPPVPPEVSNKKTLDEQIKEMREWFKAFRDQDHSVRDYRKYFKPNLCYLEGGWTLNAKTLSEPFQSDRHHIDAESWFDLQEKIRFSSYGGSKSNLENFAYLPTTLYNFTQGIPQLAQWNYRILCHPLKKDVPTNYLILQDDLAPRVSRRYTWDRMPTLRAARFRINEFGTEREAEYSLLDELMSEIPGKDNYGANLTDNTFGRMHYDAFDKTRNVPLNAAHYHRWYKLNQNGRTQINHRGFRDQNLWVAKTTQPNIMPLTIRLCHKGNCHYETTRVTFALPLEIVFSTPLQSWNPLDLEFHEPKYVIQDGRTGEQTPAKAFNGTSFRHYYRTPVEFYSDGTSERDAADTARTAVGVLDRHGQVKKAAPTGFRIMSQKIQDVGSVRIRYPIFPAHSQGGTIGEELEALKEIVMNMNSNADMFEETLLGKNASHAHAKDVDFHLRDAYKNPPGLHGHDITVTEDEYKSLLNDKDVTVTTSFNLGHNHEIVLSYNINSKVFYYKKCDGQPRCWDGHSTYLDLQRT